MRKILIVENDQIFREGLEITLTREGYSVLSATKENDAMHLVRTEKPHLALVDVMLDESNGLDLCKGVRNAGFDLPVIMMSCYKKDETDCVIGLELGADDYLVKPFGERELLARIRACIRRSSRFGELMSGCSFDDTEIDFRTRSVKRQGATISLTARQFELLMYLIRKKGQVVSREELFREVWGYEDNLSTRTIDSHILILRKKLEPDPRKPRHFLAERGTGYRFV